MKEKEKNTSRKERQKQHVCTDYTSLQRQMLSNNIFPLYNLYDE